MCLVILFLLMVQIICRFSIGDKVKLNLFMILGTKMNKVLEYCLNKIISFNRGITTIYIWLLILILITILAYSVYISNDLYTNVDSYVYTYNNMKKIIKIPSQ